MRAIVRIARACGIEQEESSQILALHRLNQPAERDARRNPSKAVITRALLVNAQRRDYHAIRAWLGIARANLSPWKCVLCANREAA